MTTPVHVGDLAFLGPPHTNKLTDFQYVEVVGISDNVGVVKITGPDDDSQTDTLELPLDAIKFRLVSESERRRWPGSFIAHPIAFVQTSKDGVDEWAYGVVSGYAAFETTDVLHIVGANGPCRLPLVNTQSVIKVAPLNYALQPGGGVNFTALNPMELLHQQDTLIATSRKRKTGIPASVMASLSVSFSADELVPLVKPSTLQLVRVRRQHLVDFVTAARANRPEDLYSDSEVNPKGDPLAQGGNKRTEQPNPDGGRGRSNTKRPIQRSDVSLDDDEDSNYSEEDDIQEVQHMNASLLKRRRTNDDSEGSDNSSTSTPGENINRDIVFHPSPTDRRIHAMIVNRRHTGKIPQILLQSVQQSPYVEFVGSPAVLRGLYSFGFGLGLSIMHCRRALVDDEVATSEKGANLWDFSSKNDLPTPPKATCFTDLISALNALHKFGQHFYNITTADFIADARNFIIDYADHARSDPTMARLLAFWINGKFSLFRSKLITENLSVASAISAQFCQSDDKLAALQDSCHTWKQNSHPSRIRTFDSDRSTRPHKSSTSNRIPPNVFADLPKSDDGRRVCLKFLSKSGCQYAKCSSGHFRPQSLTKGAKAVIGEGGVVSLLNIRSYDSSPVLPPSRSTLHETMKV